VDIGRGRGRGDRWRRGWHWSGTRYTFAERSIGRDVGGHVSVLNLKSLLLLTFVSSFLIGCTRGDGIIVVTLKAQPAIVDIASLRVDLTVGSAHRQHSVDGISAIDDTGAASFGIDVSADFGSTIAISIEALDSSGLPLGMGTATAPIRPGKASAITVSLSRSVGVNDDMGPSPDLAGSPNCSFDEPTQTFDHCLLGP
jgi:hypothetical protein